MPPMPAAPPAVESIVAPVPGVDPWVAAAIAEAPVLEAPLAPAPAAYEPLPLPPTPVAPPPVAYEPLPLPPDPLAPAPAAAAPAAAPAAVATVEAPTWPCTSCGTRVDFAEMACPSCHTPFMGGAAPDISLKVPGVGDLVHMSSGAKFGVMAGGAAALAGILVLIFLILGHIF